MNDMSFFEVDNWSELIASLSSREDEPLIVKSPSGSFRKFFIIRYRNDDGVYQFGIAVSYLGVLPKTMMWAQGGSICVGYDYFISIVDVEHRCVRCTSELSGTFLDFVPIDGGVLVIHELGVQRMSDVCSTQWEVVTDIVVDWVIESNKSVVITTDLGERVVVDVLSGQTR